MPRTNGKRILVVEDSDDSRMLMGLSLRQHGYEVVEAIDGREALDLTAIACPDLIIMDIAMPRLDGLEAAVCLKSDPKTRDIPIIFATAHTRESLLTNAIGAGAVEVLIKPLDLSELAKLVRKCLRSHGSVSRPVVDAAGRV